MTEDDQDPAKARERHAVSVWRQEAIEAAAKAIFTEGWPSGSGFDGARVLAGSALAAALPKFLDRFVLTTADADAVVQAACDEAGWDWEPVPAEGIPSPLESMRPVIEAALEVLVAGLRREVEQG